MSAKKIKIIFVCTGNTCRSPMAEILLTKALEKFSLKGISVASAGIAAKRGDTINPKSAHILSEYGLEVGEFKSKKLNDRMLREAYAIICMTEKQRDYLMDARWNALRKKGEEAEENNVYSFAELVGYEIPDPYGKDIEHYRYVFEQLARGMSALIEKLGLRAVATAPKKRGRPKKETTSKTEKKVAVEQLNFLGD